VCQVHEATGVLVRSWWLNGRASATLLDHTAAVIKRTQQRNTFARECHTRKTIKKLQELGIDVTQLTKCTWNTS
jgi:phosphopentomutase